MPRGRPRKTAPPDEGVTILNLEETPNPNEEGAIKPRRKYTKRKSKEVNPEVLEKLHERVFPVFAAAALQLPPDNQPTPEELSNMLLPVERIGLRHMPNAVKSNDPDTEDILSALGTFAFYAARAFVAPLVTRILQRRNMKHALKQQTYQEPIRFAPSDNTSKEKQGKPPMTNEMKQALDPNKQPTEQLAQLHDYLIKQQANSNQ